MGAPNDERAGLPGYEGYLNDRALSVAQLLKDGGYHTYLAGKWHLGSRTTTATTGSGKTPDQWGFERSFCPAGRRGRQSFYPREPDVSKLHERRRLLASGATGRAERLLDGGLHRHPDREHRLEPGRQEAVLRLRGVHGAALAAGSARALAQQIQRQVRRRLRADRRSSPADASKIAEFCRNLSRPTLGVPETLTRSPATAADGTAAAKYINAIHSPPTATSTTARARS